MLLTKQQIECFVERLGQPRASVLLNSFFQSYRTCLRSEDVALLYDETYLARIGNHPTDRLVRGRYKIHIYNRYSYEYLLPRIATDTRLLDAGCGDGDFALAVAHSGAAEVVGVDFDGKAIELAESKRIASECRNCHFLRGDVSVLELSGPFDYCVLNDVVEHLSDEELMLLLDRLRKLLRHGGEVVIHTPNGLALCNDTDSDRFQRAYKRYLQVFEGWRGHGRTVDQIYYDQVHINIKSFRQLRALLRRSGYRARVFYDEPSRFPFLSRFSTNMLVIGVPVG